MIGRVLAWVLAIALLIAETREVFELRQLTQLTQFALIFLLAQYQLSTAIYYKTFDDVLAVKIKKCSSQMFLAKNICELHFLILTANTSSKVL